MKLNLTTGLALYKQKQKQVICLSYRYAVRSEISKQMLLFGQHNLFYLCFLLFSLSIPLTRSSCVRSLSYPPSYFRARSARGRWNDREAPATSTIKPSARLKGTRRRPHGQPRPFLQQPVNPPTTQTRMERTVFQRHRSPTKGRCWATMTVHGHPLSR